MCDAFADASDIPEWAATAVRAAAAKGIVKGYRNGKMVLIKIAGFK
ncbi:S-layer homology domain-containing protein [Thermobacillus xylanilyticus]